MGYIWHALAICGRGNHEKIVCIVMIVVMACGPAFLLVACNTTPDEISDNYENLADGGSFDSKKASIGESIVYVDYCLCKSLTQLNIDATKCME